MVMKTAISYIVMVLALVIVFFTGVVVSAAGVPLKGVAQGRDFWFAIPMNDDPVQPVIGLEIYVTSDYDTEVTVELPLLGSKTTKPVKAGEVTVFSSVSEPGMSSWEISTSEKIENKGVHIYSPQPICVNVINGKQVTADGFTAIPTSMFGREYVHCAYYDFGESRSWAGGFMIVAAENNTEITIQLGGRNSNGAGRTFGGKNNKNSVPFKVLLNSGQVYCVRGNGATAGSFDLSGSQVISNKPVGFLSYHMRTIIPTDAQNGRNYLVEMMPPVQAWGKKYVTVELDRKGKGDYFRVVAAKPSTKFSMKYYDIKTGNLVGQRSGVIPKGDFVDFFNTWGGVGAVEGIKGMSVWEADGPILVMQYAYSANWDGSDSCDPFMTALSPVEQFQSSFSFQRSQSNLFSNNIASFIIEGDSSDKSNTLLKSVVMNGELLYKKYPLLLTNRISGTNYYWARVPLSNEAQQVISGTRIGGYVYGYSAFNCYGWPLFPAGLLTTIRDTLPPVLIKNKLGYNEYEFSATELRSISPETDTTQTDQGILDVRLLPGSTNCLLEYITAPIIVAEPKTIKFDFRVRLEAGASSGRAIVAVIDRAGNTVIDTTTLEKTIVTITPLLLHMKTFTGSRKKQQISIQNLSQIDINVASVQLMSGTVFSIDSGAVPPLLTLKPAQKHIFTIKYMPVQSGTDIDHDSVVIITTASPDKIILPVYGTGAVCEIISTPAVASISAKVGAYSETNTVRIDNPTADTIRLLSAKFTKGSVFTIDSGNILSPTTLLPGKNHIFKIRYKPLQAGSDQDTLIVSTDCGAEKSMPFSGEASVVGVEEITPTASFVTVMPNPTGGELRVLIRSAPGRIYTYLTDAMGRDISGCAVEFDNAGENEFVLPCSESLATGIYKLRIFDSAGMEITSTTVIIRR